MNFQLHVKPEDQEEHRRFLCLTFDPGGHLQNSKSNSLQEGEKLMQDGPMVPMGRRVLWHVPPTGPFNLFQDLFYPMADKLMKLSFLSPLPPGLEFSARPKFM